MDRDLILLLPIVLPVLCGVAVFAFRMERRVRLLNIFTLASVLGAGGASLAAMRLGDSLTLVRIAPGVELSLASDGVSGLFATLTWVLVALAAVFSFRYMTHSGNRGRFAGFTLVCLGMLLGADFSGNIVTLYLFYEGVTLSSFPLVLHDGTPEAVSAGLKYLFYSIAGALLALFGISVAVALGLGNSFVPGGIADPGAFSESRGLLLAACACAVVGFGAKCGLFPLHGWLPTAHPVAPAPASAMLSGTITKLGVLGIVRAVYYLFGPELIRGTWVQTLWLVLACITVIMGSTMAWGEKLLKKRLAWSSVSQLSYILLGLGLLTPQGFTGALLHVAAHACIKNGLFLFAGAVIFSTGITSVDGLWGVGKRMKAVFGSFVLLSVALVGIPPASAFLSKWYLCLGALESGISVFSWLGPVVLLVSALLTAGYLFPIFIQGFFPGKKEPVLSLGEKPGALMTAPLGVLALGCMVTGLFPGSLLSLAETLCLQVF